MAKKAISMTLRILTYNIHGAKGVDGKRDFRRIGNFLKKQNIDIALIQELHTLFADRDTDQDIADLMADHFLHIAAAPTVIGPNGWYGNALLSKFPVTKRTVIDISKMGREPRNILEAFVQTPVGLLHVINTHKGLGYFERSQQMKKLNHLLRKKGDLPLIVGGDINEWHNFAGALRKLNITLCPIPAGRTFPTALPLFHLDRMWCRPKNILVNSKVLKTKETKIYSDHYPVLSEIKIYSN
jgi:endonuclease/exonuclease/phosphatase family metal-dependent hydrolase